MAKTANTDLSTEQGKLTFKRLLIAKQLYVHGIEHSTKDGHFDKMIAVHNFHNAIEIVLKAIVQHYQIDDDIRNQFKLKKRGLDFTFMQCLNGVNDNHSLLNRNLRLPYFRDLQNLNLQRNQVQHSAFEPPSDMMEMWKVITREFLEQTYREYFGLDFNTEVSQVSLIESSEVRELLHIASLRIRDNNIKEGIAISKIVFEIAIRLAKFLNFVGYSPHSPSATDALYTCDETGRFEELIDFLAPDDPSQPYEPIDHPIVHSLLDISREIAQMGNYVTLIASGINVSEFKNFVAVTPEYVSFNDGILSHRWIEGLAPSEEQAWWIHEFVANTILTWQEHGFKVTLEANRSYFINGWDFIGLNARSFLGGHNGAKLIEIKLHQLISSLENSALSNMEIL